MRNKKIMTMIVILLFLISNVSVVFASGVHGGHTSNPTVVVESAAGLAVNTLYIRGCVIGSSGGEVCGGLPQQAIINHLESQGITAVKAPCPGCGNVELGLSIDLGERDKNGVLEEVKTAVRNSGSDVASIKYSSEPKGGDVHLSVAAPITTTDGGTDGAEEGTVTLSHEDANFVNNVQQRMYNHGEWENYDEYVQYRTLMELEVLSETTFNNDIVPRISYSNKIHRGETPTLEETNAYRRAASRPDYTLQEYQDNLNVQAYLRKQETEEIPTLEETNAFRASVSPPRPPLSQDEYQHNLDRGSYLRKVADGEDPTLDEVRAAIDPAMSPERYSDYVLSLQFKRNLGSGDFTIEQLNGYRRYNGVEPFDDDQFVRYRVNMGLGGGEGAAAGSGGETEGGQSPDVPAVVLPPGAGQQAVPTSIEPTDGTPEETPLTRDLERFELKAGGTAAGIIDEDAYELRDGRTIRITTNMYTITETKDGHDVESIEVTYTNGVLTTRTTTEYDRDTSGNLEGTDARTETYFKGNWRETRRTVSGYKITSTDGVTTRTGTTRSFTYDPKTGELISITSTITTQKRDKEDKTKWDPVEGVGGIPKTTQTYMVDMSSGKPVLKDGDGKVIIDDNIVAQNQDMIDAAIRLKERGSWDFGMEQLWSSLEDAAQGGFGKLAGKIAGLFMSLEFMEEFNEGIRKALCAIGADKECVTSTICAGRGRIDKQEYSVNFLDIPGGITRPGVFIAGERSEIKYPDGSGGTTTEYFYKINVIIENPADGEIEFQIYVSGIDIKNQLFEDERTGSNWIKLEKGKTFKRMGNELSRYSTNDYDKVCVEFKEKQEFAGGDITYVVYQGIVIGGTKKICNKITETTKPAEDYVPPLTEEEREEREEKEEQQIVETDW